MNEKEQKAQKKAAFKEAKKSYNAARRDAGKTRKPLAIVIVIVILAAALAGAAAAWYITNQQDQQKIAAQQEQISQLQQQLSELQQQPTSQITQGGTDSSSQSSSTEQSAANEKASAYVGTWTGSMTSTDTANGQCKGASEHPLTLKITKLESSGQITGDAEVLYHGHGTIQTDASSTEGDTVENLQDLTGTLTSNGNFDFTSKVTDAKDGSVSISVSTEKGTSGNTLQVKVTSKNGWNTVTDYYDLSKTN